MTRTKIQLPDELYQRAKTFAQQREISFAEVVRRGIELFISRFPGKPDTGGECMLPRIDAGSLKAPLKKLREIATSEEAMRSLS
jgi:hypothetical protein